VDRRFEREHAFEVDGKLLAVRRSLLLKDTSGQELYESTSRSRMSIRPRGQTGDKVVMTIQKA